MHFVSGVKILLHQHTKGIRVNINIQGQGTIQFNIEYDDESLQNLYIKDTLYVPESPLDILFPQHWAKQANGNFPKRHGTYTIFFKMTASYIGDSESTKASSSGTPILTLAAYDQPTAYTSIYYLMPWLSLAYLLPWMNRTSILRPYT